MTVRERAGTTRNTITLLAAGVMLSGCLMGEPVDDPGEALGMESELTGSVGDGPIVNASMRVLTADGAILSEFTSDATAGYSIKVRANNNDYPLIIDAWSGTDLVTGLAPDFAMRGAGVKPGSKLIANVNPYSTLAVEVAIDLNGGTGVLSPTRVAASLERPEQEAPALAAPAHGVARRRLSG